MVELGSDRVGSGAHNVNYGGDRLGKGSNRVNYGGFTGGRGRPRIGVGPMAWRIVPSSCFVGPANFVPWPQDPNADNHGLRVY